MLSLFFTRDTINKDRFYLIAVFAFLFLFLNLNAQHPELHLTGITLDSETNKPIESVNVRVVDESIYATTKPDGTFELTFKKLGAYQIKITHVAYKEELKTIDLIKDNHQRLVFYLIPKAIDISPVIVMGQNTLTKFDEIYESSNVLRGKELGRYLKERNRSCYSIYGAGTSATRDQRPWRRPSFDHGRW